MCLCGVLSRINKAMVTKMIHVIIKDTNRDNQTGKYSVYIKTNRIVLRGLQQKYLVRRPAFWAIPLHGSSTGRQTDTSKRGKKDNRQRACPEFTEAEIKD